MKSSTFTGNIAKDSNGGAIIAENVKSILIESSKFNGNYAEYDGGVIYTSCNNKFDCKLKFSGVNTFSKNRAN